VDAWCASQQLSRGAVLTLAQVWLLAQFWYGDRLSAEFRRPTRDEAQAIFARVGLTGDFWRLG
jgi:hypothetical protein